MSGISLILLILGSLFVVVSGIYILRHLEDQKYDYGKKENFKIPQQEMDRIAKQFSENGGRVLYQDSQDYDGVSLPWNPKCLKRPYAIFQPNSYEDARDALMLCKEYRQNYTIMAGGHDFECESMTNNTIVNLGLFKGIEPNYAKSEIKVQAGVKWREVYKALNDTGYEVIGGMCPPVGVAGFTLGGGFHWRLSHYWGTAAQNVKQAVVVLATGEIVKATRDNQYSDLLWALMGAGGLNFGLVLEFTFNIHPYPQKKYTLFSVSYVFVPDNPSYKGYDQLITTALAWRVKMEDLLEKEGNGGGGFVLQRPDPTQNYQIMSVDGLCQDCDYENILAEILQLFPPDSINAMNAKITTSQYEIILEESLGAYPSALKTNNPAAFLQALPDSEFSSFLTGYLEQPYIGYQLEVTILRNMVKNKEKTSFAYPDAKWKFAQTVLWDQDKDGPGAYYLTGLWNVIVQNAMGHNYLGGYINYDDMTVQNYQKIFFGDNLKRLVKMKQKYDSEDFFHRKLGVPLQVN